MFIGAVNWFNAAKGFGMIALPGGETLFLHISSFRQKPDNLLPGDVVIGESQPDTKHDGMRAKDCRLAISASDWPVLITLLGRSDEVAIGKGTKRLLSLALSRICRVMDADELCAMAIDGLPEVHHRPEVFLPYAQLLKSTLPHYLGKVKGNELLARIYALFGKHATPDILFLVWKNHRFRYLGLLESGDYEIPEEVFNLHATELYYADLQRIRHYSFGSTFCSEFISALLDGADTMDREEIDQLLPYLDLLGEEEKAHWKNIVNP